MSNNVNCGLYDALCSLKYGSDVSVRFESYDEQECLYSNFDDERFGLSFRSYVKGGLKRAGCDYGIKCYPLERDSMRLYVELYGGCLLIWSGYIYCYPGHRMFIDNVYTCKHGIRWGK